MRGLERQVGQDADHVGVAGPLAVAVDGRLDVADPGRDGGHRVGHRELGVVMGVDPEGQAGRVAERGVQPGADQSDDRHQLVRERAAVGVAQDQRPGAALPGGPQGLDGVGRVVLEAIEEVLGVVHDLAPVIDDEADGVRDHVEVLGRRGAQHLDHVELPALAEDRHDRRLGGDQLAQVGVRLGRVGAVPGHPEGGQPGALPAHRAGGGEELDVLGVRARPAALDERHPVLVQHPRHAQLVGQRQRDVLALGAVAQGRVVQDDRAVVRRRRRRRPASSVMPGRPP